MTDMAWVLHSYQTILIDNKVTIYKVKFIYKVTIWFPISNGIETRGDRPTVQNLMNYLLSVRAQLT